MSMAFQGPCSISNPQTTCPLSSTSAQSPGGVLCRPTAIFAGWSYFLTGQCLSSSWSRLLCETLPPSNHRASSCFFLHGSKAFLFPWSIAKRFLRLVRCHSTVTMRSGGWYYKDRLGRTRGPMELVNLKTAWAAGIVDKNTFIWGDDMDEWAPIGMVYGLEAAINSIDVRLATAGTAFIHKLAKGLPPWRPNKGHEKKSYKQLQDEAIESKEREKAVMRQHGGVWPGQRIPSHALFLWASGSELTPLIQADNMPNKYVPYALRKRLVEIIPGLRPWEIISIEQTMDRITYNGKWYREPLGTYTTGPDYAKDWSEDVKEKYDMVRDLFASVYHKLKDKLPLEEIRQKQREKKLQKMLKKSAHGRK